MIEMQMTASAFIGIHGTYLLAIIKGGNNVRNPPCASAKESRGAHAPHSAPRRLKDSLS